MFVAAPDARQYKMLRRGLLYALRRDAFGPVDFLAFWRLVSTVTGTPLFNDFGITDFA